MFVNSSLYLTCFKCFLKDYLVYIKIYSSVCILKSNTHIHTYRHKHICPSTVLFSNMLNSNTFLQYSLGLTRITGCWHAISTKHQFSLKNIYRNLNSFQVYQYLTDIESYYSSIENKAPATIFDNCTLFLSINGIYLLFIKYNRNDDVPLYSQKLLSPSKYYQV